MRRWPARTTWSCGPTGHLWLLPWATRGVTHGPGARAVLVGWLWWWIGWSRVPAHEDTSVGGWVGRIE